MNVKKQLTVDIYGERGFAFSFPYDPQLVNAIKRDLPGVNWDKHRKVWYTTGPEVMLDIRRGGYKLQYTPAALERAREFRIFIDRLLEVRYQDLSDAPYAYQEVGAQVLALQKRGILADAMGLGKSRQAILAADLVGAQTVLIVAPKTLTYNWLPEVTKWLPEAEVAVVPDTPAKREAFWENWPQRGFVIANYEKLNMGKWPQHIRWDVVVADEATYLKNSAAQRTKAFWRVADRSEYVWLLTGTPLEIRAEELYALMSKLRPTVFGHYVRFRDEHLITDYFGSVVGVQNQTLLSERIAPWVLRRTKDDVALQIPPKLYNDINIPLSEAEAVIYRRLTNEFTAWLNEQGRDSAEANALTQLLRLQQFTSDPRLVDEQAASSKLAALKELIDGWDGQALVFTRFAAMVPLIVDALNLHPEAVIRGDVKAEERVSRVTRFNAGELGKVLVSTDAGAHGLNVTSADLIVQYDLLWNPAKMAQREDRLHRIGQTKTVNVVRLLCEGTVDRGMAAVLEERQELFNNIMDGAETAVLSGLNLSKIATGQKG